MSKRVKVVPLDIHRDEDRPVNRVGRMAIGLYPEISRTKLARMIGCSTSKVSYILTGRFKCGLEMAMVLSKAAGVTVERLTEELKEQQERWAEKELVKRNGHKRKSKWRTAAR